MTLAQAGTHALLALVSFIAGRLTLWLALRKRMPTDTPPPREVAMFRRFRAWLRGPVSGNTVMILGGFFTVVLALVVLIQQQSDQREDDRDQDRLCAFVDDLSSTLRERSGNYRLGAESELEDDAADLEWKRSVKAELRKLGAAPDSALVQVTADAIRAQEASIAAEQDYLDHLKVNPVPTLGECG